MWISEYLTVRSIIKAMIVQQALGCLCHTTSGLQRLSVLSRRWSHMAVRPDKSLPPPFSQISQLPAKAPCWVLGSHSKMKQNCPSLPKAWAAHHVAWTHYSAMSLHISLRRHTHLSCGWFMCQSLPQTLYP